LQKHEKKRHHTQAGYAGVPTASGGGNGELSKEKLAPLLVSTYAVFYESNF